MRMRKTRGRLMFQMFQMFQMFEMIEMFELFELMPLQRMRNTCARFSSGCRG